MSLVDRISSYLRATVDRVWREAAKFGVVGAIAFVIDVGGFNLLYHGPLAGRLTSSRVVSGVIATLVAWLGNRFWTFRHRANRKVHHEALLFFLVNGVGLTSYAATAEHPRADPSPGVYLTLYHVAPNAALRNLDLPTRRPGGEAAQRPVLALTLRYLFSFVGDPAKFDGERLAVADHELAERRVAVGGAGRGEIGGQADLGAEELGPLEHQRHRRDRRPRQRRRLHDQALQDRVVLARQDLAGRDVQPVAGAG